jgi:hypothetical protein
MAQSSESCFVGCWDDAGEVNTMANSITEVIARELMNDSSPMSNPSFKFNRGIVQTSKK